MNNNILNLNDDDELYKSNDKYVETDNYFKNLNNQQEFSNKNEEGGAEQEIPEEEKFFKNFESQEIDNRDPSIGELLKIYEEEVPFEIKYEDKNVSKDEEKFQKLLCKIFITDEMVENINLKIEIANDEDLFFYYTTEINIETFEKIKEDQKLLFDFNNFSDLLIKYLDFCISNEKSYKAILNIQKNKKANMELMENLDCKWAQLLFLTFNGASDELIRKQIIYRYNAMRAIKDITQNRINIVNKVLKDLDPPLIKEVKNEINKSNIDICLKSLKIKEK